jgi:undecaprenyl-diphosphatase
MQMRLWLQKLDEIEAPFCQTWSHPRRAEWAGQPFALVSRLGDGVFWYSLIFALPLADGWDGLVAALHMAMTGVAALVIYKSLKGATRRERPCHSLAEVPPLVAPLDHYSFPSGHTLHAVSFSVVAIHYYPKLAWVVVPFTLLVAVSRVFLGLHYPSDVAAAAGIGLLLAYAGILLVA